MGVGNFSGGGDSRPKSPYLSRLRDRPRLPSEIVGMSDEQYTEILETAGYGREFIRRELRMLKEYRTGLPKDEEAVEKGPQITPQYTAWAKRRRRQVGEESEG